MIPVMLHEGPVKLPYDDIVPEVLGAMIYVLNDQNITHNRKESWGSIPSLTLIW